MIRSPANRSPSPKRMSPSKYTIQTITKTFKKEALHLRQEEIIRGQEIANPFLEENLKLQILLETTSFMY